MVPLISKCEVILGKGRMVVPGMISSVEIGSNVFSTGSERLSRLKTMVGVHFKGGEFFGRAAMPLGLTSSPVSTTLDLSGEMAKSGFFTKVSLTFFLNLAFRIL